LQASDSLYSPTSYRRESSKPRTRLTQIVVPDKKDVAFAAPDLYTIFLEEQSVVNGRVYSATDGIGGLKCTAVSPNKENLPLRKPSTNITYDLSARSGSSVLQFDVTNSGTHTVGCKYATGASEPQAVIAVGTGLGTRIFSTVMRSLTAFLSTSAGCITIFFVAFLRRERYKRSLRDQASGNAAGSGSVPR
jgi:hypothetical protein